MKNHPKDSLKRVINTLRVQKQSRGVFRNVALVFFLGVIGITNVFAYTLVGDLVYDLNGTDLTATVMWHKNGTSATGTLVIPEKITYNGRKYTVTSIYTGAFSGCTSLTGVLTLPNTITSIGDRAFFNCTGFSGLYYNMSNCVVDNPSYTYSPFFGFSGSLELGQNVEKIPDYMFKGASFTGTLTIPSSVTEIGNSAFSLCGGFIGELTIPNSVTKIGSWAFRECFGITSVEFSNSINAIGENAFIDCNQIAFIIIHATNPPALGNDVFYNVDKNIPVAVPCGSVTAYQNAIGWSAFTNIFESSYEISAEANPPESGIVTGEGVYCSETNCTLTATPNEGYTFVNWTKNGEVVSTETTCSFTVTEGANYIANFDVPENIIEFADQIVKWICVALWDTDGSGELSYEEAAAVTDLGTTFKNQTSITSFDELQYFTGLTSIGDEAFYHCTNLTSVTIPSSVLMIGTSSFSNCTNLASLNIGNSITTIGDYAFGGCRSLSLLYIPNSVISIGNSSFSNCSSLLEIIFGNSLATIGSSAFFGCSSLTWIFIPASVSYITQTAFANCTNLTDIIVDSDNAYYDSRDNCNAIILTAYNQLVAGCKNTVIPNTVASIGVGAFYVCSGLNSLIIPNSVTIIEGMAFASCTGLTTISSLADNPPMLFDNSFLNVDKSIPVFVPYGSINDYQVANGWSEFTNYQGLACVAVPGYGSGPGNYRFIASPLAENTDPITVENLISESDYDLFRFDQSEALEWQNYKAHTGSFVLENGQGYLYANAEDMNLVFKGVFNENESKEVGLVYEADKPLAGWNLIGNPFPVQAYCNKSYYVMNEEGTNIEPVAVSMETPIPACTGVMVKADNQGETVIFNRTAPEDKKTNQGMLQIIVTRNDAVLDKAIVSFNENEELKKIDFNEGNAKLYFPKDGKDYAIVCVCRDAACHAPTEIPINFMATKNGKYSLTISCTPHSSLLTPNFKSLHLIDNQTGADVNLLQTPSYTFEAKLSDSVSRFKLVLN